MHNRYKLPKIFLLLRDTQYLQLLDLSEHSVDLNDIPFIRI